MQKYIHLVQIVETEKVAANQLRTQLEDQDTEIERLKAEEQQLCFEALAQEQAESRWALHKLLQPTTSPAVSPATIPHVALTKLASTLDPEAFFAAQQLLPRTQLEYLNIKRAVLQCFSGGSPGDHPW
ncbi:hypothetical protein PDJAM_G00146320 [Pangasius djambal]|uniref:Uncharacterized protein n=1 Tax=Pangasius djambal TaxID=1691987 RepID=A0ACC5ZFN2_9TELE|nr:hypothetical protein [Pangasius djambal]